MVRSFVGEVFCGDFVIVLLVLVLLDFGEFTGEYITLRFFATYVGFFGSC